MHFLRVDSVIGDRLVTPEGLEPPIFWPLRSFKFQQRALPSLKNIHLYFAKRQQKKTINVTHCLFYASHGMCFVASLKAYPHPHQTSPQTVSCCLKKVVVSCVLCRLEDLCLQAAYSNFEDRCLVAGSQVEQPSSWS